jgi:hypothetical protein
VLQHSCEQGGGLTGGVGERGGSWVGLGEGWQGACTCILSALDSLTSQPDVQLHIVG